MRYAKRRKLIKEPTSLWGFLVAASLALATYILWPHR